MLERFWFNIVPGTGRFRVFVKPGRVGSQVALGGVHLGDPPSYEFPQAHEEVRG